MPNGYNMEELTPEEEEKERLYRKAEKKAKEEEIKEV